MDRDDPSGRRLTLLILSGDMEKGLAACNLALSAAAAQRPVTLFFSFWGLNFLKAPGARSRGSLLTRLFGGLNRNSSESQRLGRFHLWGLGRWTMRRLMASRGMAEVYDNLKTLHAMGAHIVACSNTMELMGLDPEKMVPEVDAVEGAMAFLQESGEGQTLCIS